MASCWSGSYQLTILILCLSWISVNSLRTRKKIYIDLETQNSCFRIMNATHQTGCTSSRRGNVGVLYYLRTAADYEWVTTKGPNAPYIVVMNSSDFMGLNIKELLKHRDRVNGIMFISLEENTTSLYPEIGFSAVDTCPNDRSGLYWNHKDFGSCKKTTWNTAGTGLLHQDIGIPVFSLTDPNDVHNVLHNCFFKFNMKEPMQPSTTYPLCAAEAMSFMVAAVDTVTCLRRSSRVSLSLSGGSTFCDPLGDVNNHVTMLNTPQNVTRLNDTVIVVGTRVDSTSLINYQYTAADTSAAGIVGLLAAMEALWKVKDTIRNTTGAKDIMFAFFQGESYDYIGSSSMVYSMQQGTFPQDLDKDEDALHLQRIRLQHIDQFVELNQVGYRDESSLWLHTDPHNHRIVTGKIEQMIDGLKQAAKPLDVSLQEADKTQPLPPASAQRFLLERGNVPVVVITDHQAEFTNKFYNSHLDMAELINATDYPPGLSDKEKYDYVTTQAEMLANLSTALARYLFKASTGLQPDKSMEKILTADSSTVTHLLYCFLISPNCEIFKETVSPQNAQTLEEAMLPFPFYVGVNSHETEVSALISLLSARFTGDIVNLDQSDCKQPNSDVRYTYTYVQGNVSADGKSRTGWCLKSLAQKTEALSPAFTIDGYDMMSGQYSTWTESRWITVSVRLFLVPSQQMQLLILCTGLVVLVLSLLLVYLVSSSADVVFSNYGTRSTTPATAAR
ncbi:nicastrin [Plakobranchus ocellatus]|uniref:Nicastrin n=1 Tax=Plakobranchus ocellatus TaxID=259542 RepID=A0AAV3ZCA2_9GAST|nr:nicastrin [Plakobranchus ocellatus]